MFTKINLLNKKQRTTKGNKPRQLLEQPSAYLSSALIQQKHVCQQANNLNKLLSILKNLLFVDFQLNS